jgi:hypothetical protein
MTSPAPIVISLEDSYVLVVFKAVGRKHKLTMEMVLIEWLDFKNSWQDAT